jgi:hypothetical protein
MLLGVISCSLRSARHDYCRQLVGGCYQRRPNCLPRPTSGRSRECHALRRRRGARRQPHHHCSRRLQRSGLSRSCSPRARGCERQSHGSFLQGDSLDGLVHMSQWTLLWTTNTILWIRTAVRRFLLRVDADANVYAAMYEQGRVLAFSSARPSAATAQARSAN